MVQSVGMEYPMITSNGPRTWITRWPGERTLFLAEKRRFWLANRSSFIEDWVILLFQWLFIVVGHEHWTGVLNGLCHRIFPCQCDWTDYTREGWLQQDLNKGIYYPVTANWSIMNQERSYSTTAECVNTILVHLYFSHKFINNSLLLG